MAQKTTHKMVRVYLKRSMVEARKIDSSKECRNLEAQPVDDGCVLSPSQWFRSSWRVHNHPDRNLDVGSRRWRPVCRDPPESCSCGHGDASQLCDVILCPAFSHTSVNGRNRVMTTLIVSAFQFPYFSEYLNDKYVFNTHLCYIVPSCHFNMTFDLCHVLWTALVCHQVWPRSCYPLQTYSVLLL